MKSWESNDAMIKEEERCVYVGGGRESNPVSSWLSQTAYRNTTYQIDSKSVF